MFLIILAVFVSLSLLVFFHEFGHFIFCKIFNVRVEEFGFGYPPRLIGLVKTDQGTKIFFGKKIPPDKPLSTIYSLNLIPFGGFNKIKSEFGERQGDIDSFSAKPWWQRTIIALGGIFFNIILAIVLLTVVFSLGSYQVLPEGKNLPAKDISIQIVEVVKNSPAERANLNIGDKILAVDGRRVSEVSDFQNYVKDKLLTPIILKVQRDGKMLEIHITPASAEEIFQDKNLSGAAIGVALVRVGKISYLPPVAFWQAIKRTSFLFYQIAITIISLLKTLFAGERIGVGVVGVVGLAVMTGKIAQLGLIYLLQFVATVSILIAFTQLIPFPAIDGGRIVFFVLEGIRKKPINYKIEATINNIGFVLLIILMLFVTYKDIVRIDSGFFEKILFK